MAHATPKLEAVKRERLGTRYSRRVRREGRLPAVVYGHGKDPFHVTVCGEQFVHHLHEGAHIVELAHEAGNETCLIKDVQYDYLGDNIVHVDLARIDLTEEVTVKVPIVIKGRDLSPGAKAPNSIVELMRNDIEVICLAGNIPDSVVADIGAMEINTTLLVKDLKMPQGVRAGVDGEGIVVSVHETREVALPEPGTEGTGAEPEVLTERKKEEGAEGEAKADAKAAKPDAKAKTDKK